jgi:hypothetical protein
MRIVVVSDSHRNLTALDAVIADLNESADHDAAHQLNRKMVPVDRLGSGC